MNIGIIVFAYNRNEHLQKTLDGLKENKEVSKLYIFQNGLKCEEHRKGWELTQQVIRDIDWCKVEYRLSPYNKGLANSIVDGVNTVFEENEAVIVLEDDCVPTANFIRFMTQCFYKYQDDKRIYSVSGFAWPIDLIQNEYDIYCCGRISSLGWGTWKDRWCQYNIDNDILIRLKGDKEKSRYLAAWGDDCERTLLDKIARKNDSWAIYWALIVIENRGICINPYKSLIRNIGFDGTGVHSGISNFYNVELDNGVKLDFNLPEKLHILQTTEYAFADLYGNYTAASIVDKEKENVLIYGLGNFFKQYEKEINHNYNIVAFIDRWKKDWHAGRKILKLDDVKDYAYDKIIIMVQSIQECIKIVREMIDIGIKCEPIILGHSLYGVFSTTINELSVIHDGRLLLKFGNTPVIIESEDEFDNVYAVFVDHAYSYFVNNARRDIVIDVGMDIGGASLYFAQRANVDKVYGYEPSGKTFMRAEENLKQYIETEKVNIFQYGIKAENAIRKNEQSEQIEVRKASEVFKPIFEEHPNHNIILKMNCVSGEYGILEELLQSGILGKFQFIMLEWHYKGKEILLDYLKKAGLSWWCSDKSAEMGFVYAFQCKENISNVYK